MPVASWRTEPERVTGSWWAFRQVAPDWPPFYHAAGEPLPSQRSGRWHRQGQGYAQYLALEPLGAWAELVRYENVRTAERAAEYRRLLWLAYVTETDIADLSTFDRWAACELDPAAAVGDHAVCQDLADDLREAGFRGVLAPSAALSGATNLTLFGARYEKVLLHGLAAWANPRPELRVACTLAAQGGPPLPLLTATVHADVEHEGLVRWRTEE